MNKILSGLLIAGFLGAAAQADVVRVEAGAGMWQNELAGSITSKQLAGTGFDTFSADLLAYDKETKGYAWVNIKHPVPVLPNLRLEYTGIDYVGTSTQTFTYKSVSYAASAQTNLTFDQFDIIGYYNILDNTGWVTVDVGLDIKVIQTEFNAVDNIGGNSINVKETLPVPMAYGRLRLEIPGTDLGLEGDMKYVAYKGSKFMDYRLKADYVLVDVLPVDVGLEVGYRFQKIKVDGAQLDVDTSGELEFDGVFVGAIVKF